MKTANYHTKDYPMGYYKYEWGTLLPYQRGSNLIVAAKANTMTEQEILYWQKYFIKKYAKKA